MNGEDADLIRTQCEAHLGYAGNNYVPFLYNHLVANLVVFHNVMSMTRVLQALSDEGYPVTPEIITRLSPHKTEHINRFGHYELRFDQTPQPITEDLRLSPTLAVG